MFFSRTGCALIMAAAMANGAFAQELRSIGDGWGPLMWGASKADLLRAYPQAQERTKVAYEILQPSTKVGGYNVTLVGFNINDQDQFETVSFFVDVPIKSGHAGLKLALEQELGALGSAPTVCWWKGDVLVATFPTKERKAFVAAFKCGIVKAEICETPRHLCG